MHKKKVGLVLEGGGMRGLFSTAVIDVLLKENIEADCVIGVSAGALFGINYYSKQIGRGIRYNKRYCKKKRYISLVSFLTTGNVVNRKFAYHTVPEKLDKFDNQEFIKAIHSGKKFYAVVTNIETGKAEYLDIEDPFNQIDAFCATSALPLVTKTVVIDNKKYLDGGVGDSIPILEMQKQGCDKIVVVLTQPKDYIKPKISSKTLGVAKLRYKSYPKLLEAMEDRHLRYNETLAVIKKLEESKQIFVIRPKEKINIHLIEHNRNAMQAVYDQGIEVATSCLPELKKYLEK